MPLTKIEIPSENKLGSLPGYLSSGDFKAGVIVIQEWWGVNDHIKGLAERWYADKFVVLVPDLYRGKVGHNHEEAGHIFKGLDWQGAVQDIQGSVNYLKSKGVEKVGVTGFCMGGALSIAASVFTDGVNAAAPFYGIPRPQVLECDAGKARVPLQLHFGTKDSAVGFSDPESQDKLEKVLKDNGRVYEFYRYEGAEHAFANETATGRYNAEYAKLAHQRTLDFFNKYLN